MKAKRSLRALQQEMKNRAGRPGHAGRPPLAIGLREIVDLWADGYSPRGMATYLGCDKRTIRARVREYFPHGLELALLPDSMLYHLGMQADSHKNRHKLRFLFELLRRAEHREYLDRGRRQPPLISWTSWMRKYLHVAESQ